MNLTKNDKKKYNKTYFNDYVVSNSFFIKYYYNKSRINNISNCIVGWKLFQYDDSDDE